MTCIPKTIWFFWSQGLGNAPMVVRKCHQSWIARNPGWSVVALDRETLAAFVSVDYSAGNLAGLSRQQTSDLIRLDLLSHHGGVWADATTICARPLDDWLPPAVESGFFAFYRPRPERVIATWFLAAEPGNVLVSRLFDLMLGYWAKRPVRRDNRRIVVKALTRILRVSPQTRSWWFSRALRDWLGASPYFAIHYGFEKLVREDSECARAWASTPRISACPPLQPYRSGLLSPASPALRSEMDRGETPVYKTTWRLPSEMIPGDSVLTCILACADVKPS